MGLFETKPVLVEAELLPVDPTVEDLDRVIDFLRKIHFGFRFETQKGYINAFFNDSKHRVPFGRWIVKRGENQIDILELGEFAQRYRWVGPKVYHDAPYLVN